MYCSAFPLNFPPATRFCRSPGMLSTPGGWDTCCARKTWTLSQLSKGPMFWTLCVMIFLSNLILMMTIKWLPSSESRSNFLHAGLGLEVLAWLLRFKRQTTSVDGVIWISYYTKASYSGTRAISYPCNILKSSACALRMLLSTPPRLNKRSITGPTFNKLESHTRKSFAKRGEVEYLQWGLQESL